MFLEPENASVVYVELVMYCIPVSVFAKIVNGF